MSEDYITTVMETLGWPADETFIPVANHDNRQLIETINLLSQQKLEKAKNNEILEDRVRSVKSHLDSSNLEVEQNLKLLNAKRNEFDAEDHFLKVSVNDENCALAKLKDTDIARTDLIKHTKWIEEEDKKITANLGVLNEKIQWARSAIEEFRQAMEHGESTKLLIEKYCEHDRARGEALEAKMTILQAGISKQRQVLIEAYEEQKSFEQVLERTAQLYRKAHVERRQMVDTWKEAVVQMNQREKNIQNAEIELVEAKEMSRVKIIEETEQNHFYNQQLQNNRDTERAIAELNTHTAKLRERSTELGEIISIKTMELATVKKIVHNEALLLQKERMKNRQANNLKESKLILFEKEEEEYAVLQKKNDTFKSRNLSAQDRLRQLDEMTEAEEKNMKSILNEVTRLGGALYRTQQQLQELQGDEKLLLLEIESLQVAINNNRRNSKIQEKELQRQTETVYNVDFNLELLRRRVQNMRGSGDDEHLELSRRIGHLERELAQKRQDQKLLESQVGRIEEDMRKLGTAYTQDAVEYDRLGNRLKEKQMNAEAGEKEIQKQTQSNQEHLVDQSILKMRVNQLEKVIKKQNDKRFSLEKHKIALDVAIKERLITIKTQKTILILQKKNFADELSQLRADIGERNMKIDALKKRFECTLELLGRNDDGTIVTATQIKIETAQEKHLLLKEGNSLNERVLQAEEDIKAMENTLRLMNVSNDNYRRRFERVEEDPMAVEIAGLKEQNMKVCGRIKSLRGVQAMQTIQMKEMRSKREDLDRAIDDVTRVRLDHNDVLLKLHKELIDQTVKKQRAERELKAATRSCRLAVNDLDFIALFEKDLLVKELEERNASALQQMANLAENNGNVGPSVAKAMFEKGITMPQGSRTKSNTSWKSNASGDDGVGVGGGVHSAAGSEYNGHVLSVSSKCKLSIFPIYTNIFIL